MVPGHGGCRADSSLATSRSTAASHSPPPKPATTKPSADSPSNLLTHQDHPSLGLVTRSGAWGRTSRASSSGAVFPALGAGIPILLSRRFRPLSPIGWPARRPGNSQSVRSGTSARDRPRSGIDVAGGQVGGDPVEGFGEHDAWLPSLI